MSSTDQKINQTVDKTAEQTKQELTRLRAEYEEFKRQAQPKVKEAETCLTSPSAIGFYQGRCICT
jgi:molecular chaperone GrpE (heat shock protein)